MKARVLWCSRIICEDENKLMIVSGSSDIWFFSWLRCEWVLPANYSLLLWIQSIDYRFKSALGSSRCTVVGNDGGKIGRPSLSRTICLLLQCFSGSSPQMIALASWEPAHSRPWLRFGFSVLRHTAPFPSFSFGFVLLFPDFVFVRVRLFQDHPFFFVLWVNLFSFFRVLWAPEIFQGSFCLWDGSRQHDTFKLLSDIVEEAFFLLVRSSSWLFPVSVLSAWFDWANLDYNWSSILSCFCRLRVELGCQLHSFCSFYFLLLFSSLQDIEHGSLYYKI